jgi:hypothetical protein
MKLKDKMNGFIIIYSMEAQLKLDVVMPKPIKKYSIDLSTFSVRQGLGNLDAEMDKCRRMTYDFSAPPRRASNPL